jgi:hypothetical protein
VNSRIVNQQSVTLECDEPPQRVLLETDSDPCDSGIYIEKAVLNESKAVARWESKEHKCKSE